MRVIKVNACFAGSSPCPYYKLSNGVHYCTKMMHSLEIGPAIQAWCPLETEQNSDDGIHDLKMNAAFIALKEKAAAEHCGNKTGTTPNKPSDKICRCNNGNNWRVMASFVKREMIYCPTCCGKLSRIG